MSDNNNNNNIEIEEEDLGTQHIDNPYDPSDIKIDHQNVNLGYLLEKLEFDEIDLNPDFQREGNLWDPVKKSQLIESILLGLPLPSFYFSVDPINEKWQVVDGLQRLSTFDAFWIKETLTLEGMEFLSAYEGKKKEDLTRADIRKISGFKVNLYVIEKETPKQAKFLIFKRVNTGGLILTPQEMRHALNQGQPAIFIKTISKLESFKIATDHKVPSKRQEDRDFANRFVAFYLQGYGENYQGELDSFMNNGMALLENKTQNELNELESIFDTTMNTCFNIFGIHTFRKRTAFNERRKPISRSLYDSISVNIAWINIDRHNELINSRENIIQQLMDLINQDERFKRSISTGTAQKSNVTYRFQKISELLNLNLNNDQ